MIALQVGGGQRLPLPAVSDWLETNLSLPPDFQRKILLSLLILVGLWLLRRLVMRLVRRGIKEPRALYHWGKVSSYVATITAVLLIGPQWLEGVGSVGTFLGLVAAGIAIALKDPVANLAGWGFILWRRPFELGDRIEIGTVAGDVVDIRIFQFTLLEIGNWVDADQSTGRVIHVPNAKLFTESLANSTAHFPYIWHEVPVLLTFESDWRAAKKILEEVAKSASPSSEKEVRDSMQKASEKFLIFYRNLSPIVYMTVEASGVLLTARYLCNPRARRGSEEMFWANVLDQFEEAERIALAYPTYRVIDDGPNPPLLSGSRGPAPA